MDWKKKLLEESKKKEFFLKKEQENKLKEYIELHKKGLITKETLTNLQTELLSIKNE